MSKTLKKVLFHYSALGERVNLGGGFNFYRCPGWLNSVMTPIFHSSGIPSANDLKHLEHYFARIKTRKTPYDCSMPYFCVDVTHHPKPKSIASRFTPLGYTYLGNKFICLHDHLDSFELPKGTRIVLSEYFDRHTYPLMQEQFQESFQQTPLFRREFDRMIKLAPGNTYSVLLQSGKNQVLASGLFTLKGRHCALWSGSVSKKYRGNGYSRLSIEARKLMSAGLGAESWIFFTHNPLMSGHYHSRLEYHIFNKAV